METPSELRWSARIEHGAQGVNATLLKQRLSLLYGLARTRSAIAILAWPLPFCCIRPAHNRLFAALVNRFCTMPTFFRKKLEDTAHEQRNGSHVFREYQ